MAAKSSDLPLKKRRLALMLGILRNLIPKYTEEPEVARKKQQEYKRGTISGRAVDENRLRAVVERLQLRSYAIFGGNAAVHYGARRTTLDVDILVPATVIHKVAESNPRARELAIGGLNIDVDGVSVDLVNADETPWLRAALKEAVVRDGLRFMSRVWVLVSKLIAMRGDIDVLDAIAATRGMDIEEIERARKLVKRYCPGERDDFESIIELSKLPVDNSQA